MENIGDWLYIIILIIAGISSLISSISKKKQATVQQPPREIITEGDSDYDYQFQPEATFHTERPNKKYISKQQEKPFATTKAEPPITEVEEVPSITLEDLPSDTNEWRKAFIYNEIFERKY